MSAIEIITPGWFTTVQDLGRFGFQHMGVPVSGFLDRFSAAMANLLVGNPINTPLLEITVVGPAFSVFKEMDMALAGAQMALTINRMTVPSWESHRVKPGDRVTLGQTQNGCRAYLAFGGGIHVPRVMGSFSTYAGGRTGGFHGRALKKQDLLQTGDKTLLKRPRSLPPHLWPDFSGPQILRAIPGPQDDCFDLEALFNGSYQVTEKADRMGYRLSGPLLPIRAGLAKSILSEPVMPGSVQVPPDQQPIILLNEQTVGGYAKIATVISTDLPRVAQAMPGQTIAFERIDLASAHGVLREEKQKMETIHVLFSH